MIASKTRWRAAEAASPRRRFARALDLRSEAPCGNIPAPPAVRAVMSVPFLFRLAANAAFWRGRAGDPVLTTLPCCRRPFDQKWKSTGTSTHTATGFLLLKAGLH